MGNAHGTDSTTPNVDFDKGELPEEKKDVKKAAKTVKIEDPTDAIETTKVEKKRPSLFASGESVHVPASQVVRGGSGINTKPPANGDTVFMLLHIANVPQMDVMSESDVYCTAQVHDLPENNKMSQYYNIGRPSPQLN
jgi:hypothetical protein